MDSVRRLDDQFVAKLSDTLLWAAGHGIVSRTRFHIYRDNIQWLREHDKPTERARVYAQLSGEGRLTEILSTMTESIELVETVSALRQLDVAVPIELLKRAFSGPADASREDSNSNEARNAMFELTIGAMAARRGLKPALSTGNPDVSFEFEGRCVKMECKRVLSEKRIMRRLKEGVKQLERSVHCSKSDVGIVAISLSRLINPGDRFLVSHSPHDDLSQQLHLALKANEQHLGRLHRPSATGFIFLVSTAALVPGAGYTSMSAGAVFPLNLAEQVYLGRLAGALTI